SRFLACEECGATLDAFELGGDRPFHCPSCGQHSTRNAVFGHRRGKHNPICPRCGAAVPSGGGPGSALWSTFGSPPDPSDPPAAAPTAPAAAIKQKTAPAPHADPRPEIERVRLAEEAIRTLDRDLQQVLETTADDTWCGQILEAHDQRCLAEAKKIVRLGLD